MSRHDDLLDQGPHQVPEPETAEQRSKRIGWGAAGGGIAAGGVALAKVGGAAKIFLWLFAWNAALNGWRIGGWIGIAVVLVLVAVFAVRRVRESMSSPEHRRPRYMISVAAELVGMHPQTLRIYEAKGLVRPGRTAGGTRLYSEHDLDRLRLIQRLTTELGLNLAGVQRVIALEDELTKARARLERLERQMREAVEQVHRQYRRDLVLYREAQQSPFPARRKA